MKKQKPKKSDSIRPRYEIVLRRLAREARRTMDFRQTSAYESPQSQDAWEDLKTAVLGAEQRLAPVTTSPREQHGFVTPSPGEPRVSRSKKIDKRRR